MTRTFSLAFVVVISTIVLAASRNALPSSAPISSPVIPGDLPAVRKTVAPTAAQAEQRKALYEDACEEKLTLYKGHLKALEERVADLGPEGAAELVRAVTQMQGKVKTIEGQLRAVEQSNGKSWESLRGFLDEAFYELDASLTDAQAMLYAH